MAGGKFREIPFAVDFIFAVGKFRAKSRFVNIAKISPMHKIGVKQQYIIFCGRISSQKHLNIGYLICAVGAYPCFTPVAEWVRAWDTLLMFEATVCGRS